MEAVDDVKASVKFIANARADGKPFFLWFNPSRMHIITRLSPKYEAMRNRRTAGPSRKPAAGNPHAEHSAARITRPWIATETTAPTIAQRGDELFPRVPFCEFGKPEDVGEMACWLLSDRSRSSLEAPSPSMGSWAN